MYQVSSLKQEQNMLKAQVEELTHALTAAQSSAAASDASAAQAAAEVSLAAPSC